MAYQLPSQEEKAEYVSSKFTSIAQRYDLFNDLISQGMHRCWKNFIISKSGLVIGDTAIDLCCGTGDITQRLKKAVGAEGTVIGLDFSEGMLRVAKERGITDGSCTLLQGDAMSLPFADNSADVITMGYGLRNVTDINGCLAEVFRVLKPGGRFFSLDVGKVKYSWIDPFFKFYFYKIVPLLGKLVGDGVDTEMFEYLPHSATNYPSQRRIAEILEESGFKHVKYADFVFGSSTVHRALKPYDL